MISSPVKGLTPLRAFLAGFLMTLIFIKPGITNMPGPPDLTCFSITSVRQSNTATTSFLVRQVISVIAAIIPLFDIGSLTVGIFPATFLAAILVAFVFTLVTRLLAGFFFEAFFAAMFFPH